jgi:hypothetical protein
MAGVGKLVSVLDGCRDGDSEVAERVKPELHGQRTVAYCQCRGHLEWFKNDPSEILQREQLKIRAVKCSAKICT